MMKKQKKKEKQRERDIRQKEHQKQIEQEKLERLRVRFGQLQNCEEVGLLAYQGDGPREEGNHLLPPSPTVELEVVAQPQPEVVAVGDVAGSLSLSHPAAHDTQHEQKVKEQDQEVHNYKRQEQLQHSQQEQQYSQQKQQGGGQEHDREQEQPKQQ